MICTLVLLAGQAVQAALNLTDLNLERDGLKISVSEGRCSFELV